MRILKKSLEECQIASNIFEKPCGDLKSLRESREVSKSLEEP